MKPYYYVYRHRTLAPIVRHPDFETARAEAERLAEKHPGKCFEILKALGYATTSKATTVVFSEKDDTPEKPNAKECEADKGCPPSVQKATTDMIDEDGEVLRVGDFFEYRFGDKVVTGCVEFRAGEPWVTWITPSNLDDMPVEKWWYGPYDSPRTKFLSRGKCPPLKPTSQW